MNGIGFLKGLELWDGSSTFTPHSITRVMKYFGDPQDKIPSIHVAGTNGKGSVCSALASIWGRQGHKVGLNISPHLVRINERIVVDGMSVSDDMLDFAGHELKQAVERTGTALTYHEALTAVAFLIFKELGLDLIVIEVGLGGRLDASNVLERPEACVITSIGLDHQNVLGQTIKEIAYEKAGIIKRGSRLYCGKIKEEALEVIERVANDQGVEKLIWGRDFESILLPRTELCPYVFEYKSPNGAASEFKPALKGAFQGRNMCLAIAVAEGLGISLPDAISGIEDFFWPARFERATYQGVDLIFDCAHNIDGMQAVAETLKVEGLEDLDIVFGCLQTKNWHEMIETIKPFSTSWNLLLPQSTRAVPTSEISDYLSCSGIRARDLGGDYETFLRDLRPGRTVLVVGSMYMVGALRQLIIPEERQLWQSERKHARNKN